MIDLSDYKLQVLNYISKPSNLYSIFTVAAVLFVYVLVQYFLRPLNRIKRLGDIGFYFGVPELKGVHREREIEKHTKLRRLGDLPPVFPNGWYCIAESSEIKPKEIKEVTVFGQFFSLVRSESGTVYLMEPYCPHLGASFNVGGKVVENNCVQCPFHGWIFSAETGKCTKIPYDSTIPEQAKVSTWPVVEKNKSIYVWYHCDGEEPEWDIPHIESIASGEWQYGGRTEHEVLCHCQEIPENGADIAHLNYLHLAAPSDGNDIVKMDLPDEKPACRHTWDGSWSAGVGSRKHIGTMFLDQYITFKGFKIPLSGTKLRAEQLGPGIVQMHFDFGVLGSGVVLQHVTPEQPLLQRVRFNLYSNCPRLFCKIFLLGEAFQFERDVFVWSNKKYNKNPVIVKGDGPILQHRRWYSQFYKENSPRLLKNGELSDRAKSILDW